MSVQGMEVAPLLALPLGDCLQHCAVLGPASATQYPWIPLQPNKLMARGVTPEYVMKELETKLLGTL